MAVACPIKEQFYYTLIDFERAHEKSLTQERARLELG